MNNLKIEYRSLDELIPYANNARTHSDAQIAQIAASIAEFGFVNPVLVDEDGVLIAGHPPWRGHDRRLSQKSTSRH